MFVLDMTLTKLLKNLLRGGGGGRTTTLCLLELHLHRQHLVETPENGDLSQWPKQVCQNVQGINGHAMEMPDAIQ